MIFFIIIASFSVVDLKNCANTFGDGFNNILCTVGIPWDGDGNFKADRGGDPTYAGRQPSDPAGEINIKIGQRPHGRPIVVNIDCEQ